MINRTQSIRQSVPYEQVDKEKWKIEPNVTKEEFFVSLNFCDIFVRNSRDPNTQFYLNNNTEQKKTSILSQRTISTLWRCGFLNNNKKWLGNYIIFTSISCMTTN